MENINSVAISRFLIEKCKKFGIFRNPEYVKWQMRQQHKIGQT